MLTHRQISEAMRIRIESALPPMPPFAPDIRRAPDRGFRLSRAQTEIAHKNALRYIPGTHHAVLAPEFLNELRTRG
ncbi:MAG: urocanate hydratase, partial [Desulfococcus multivorans]|nr:urocanate hydratase [Desulfococcus multivorans]